MRRLRAAAALACMLGPSAWAQDQTTVVPPAPPIVSAPIAPTAPAAPVAPTPPPGLVQTPLPPDNTDTGQAAAPPVSPAPPDIAPAPDNTWLPGKTATLGVLDEVDGGATQINIPVGGQQSAGDLQISVQACVSRPAGEIPDTAIYITVQTESSATPLFRGWMVRSTPGATVVGDAGESFRVIGCS